MLPKNFTEIVVPEFKPEEVNCLGYCGKKFTSWNKKYNRICPECKTQQNAPDIADPEKYWDDIDDINIELDPEYWTFINDI